MTKLLIITGELSGDCHAARLVDELHQSHPDLEIHALAGPALRQRRVHAFAHISSLNCMGVFDVLLALPRILKVWFYTLYYLYQLRPQCCLLVDSPAFNLPLLQWAKRFSQHVIYYIAPKTWAHGASRNTVLAKHVSLLAVIFPFEKHYFTSIPTCYVGNPLYQQALPHPNQKTAQKALSLPPKKIIALLPGSRPGEVKRLLPILIKTIDDPSIDTHHTHFILPVAPSIDLTEIKAQTKPHPIELTTEPAIAVMQAADLVVVASGTACLEAARCLTPMIVIYQVHPFTAWIAKHKLTIPWVSLPNILMQKEIVPELLQTALTPERLRQTMENLSPYQATWQQQKQALQQLYTQFTISHTSLAGAIAPYLENKHDSHHD